MRCLVPDQAVKVNSLGKWKTALQLVAMSGMMLLHKAERVAGNAPDMLDALHWGAHASLALLWAGAFLAVRPALKPSKQSKPTKNPQGERLVCDATAGVVVVKLHGQRMGLLHTPQRPGLPGPFAAGGRPAAAAVGAATAEEVHVDCTTCFCS